MNNRNNQRVRLTEAQLRQMISECVNEAMEDEGFMNQLRQGTKSFFGKGYGNDNPRNFRNRQSDFADETHDGPNWLNRKTPINLKGRIKSAIEGYKGQGKIDKNNELIKNIKSAISSTSWLKRYGRKQGITDVGQITLNMAEKILSNQNNATKANISGWNNDIYRNR